MSKKDLLISEYEQQLRMDPHNTGARWQLLLTKYDVVMAGENFLPGRYDLPPIYEDGDYLKLLKDCEGEEKQNYIDTVLRIQDIMDEARKAAETSAKYDVYLAFDNSASEDAAIAAQLCSLLANSGIEAYSDSNRNTARLPEGCRLNALRNARVLVVIATAAGCMNAPEVEGAWKRFLNMMDGDSTRHLLPAYKNVNPADFPDGISKIQGIDIGRIGVLQSILPERIKELAGRQEKVVYVKNADGRKTNLSNLLRRIQFEIEDGNFASAEKKMGDFSNKYGDGYEEFHHLRLLCTCKARNDDELAKKMDNHITANPDYRYLMKNGSDEMKSMLSEFVSNHSEYEKEAGYDKALEKARTAIAGGSTKNITKVLDDIQRRMPGFSHWSEVSDVLTESIRLAYTNSDYDKVLILTGCVKDIPQFTRWGDIQGFYDTAAARADKAGALKRYRAALGDESTFYERKLNEKYPDKVKYLHPVYASRTVNKLWYVGIAAAVIIVWTLIMGITGKMDTTDKFTFVFIGASIAELSLFLSEIRSWDIRKSLIISAIISIPGFLLIAAIVSKIYGINEAIQRLARTLLSGGLSEMGGAYLLLVLLAGLISIPGVLLKVKRITASTSGVTKKEVREFREWLRTFEQEERDALWNEYHEAVEEDWIEPTKL